MDEQDDYDKEPDFYERMTPEEKKEFQETCAEFANAVIILGAISVVAGVIVGTVKLVLFISSLFS